MIDYNMKHGQIMLYRTDSSSSSSSSSYEKIIAWHLKLWANLKILHPHSLNISWCHVIF